MKSLWASKLLLYIARSLVHGGQTESTLPLPFSSLQFLAVIAVMPKLLLSMEQVAWSMSDLCPCSTYSSGVKDDEVHCRVLQRKLCFLQWMIGSEAGGLSVRVRLALSDDVFCMS